MTVAAKINGAPIHPSEIDDSLRAVQAALTRRGILYGEVRSSVELDDNFNYPPCEKPDFSIVGVSKGEDHLIYSVRLFNESYAPVLNDLYVAVSYQCQQTCQNGRITKFDKSLTGVYLCRNGNVDEPK